MRSRTNTIIYSNWWNYEKIEKNKNNVFKTISIIDVEDNNKVKDYIYLTGIIIYDYIKQLLYKITQNHDNHNNNDNENHHIHHIDYNNNNNEDIDHNN